jgi:hypothetical protein
VSAPAPAGGHLDVRSRHRGDPTRVDPERFWAEDWAAGLDRHRRRATADAVHLGLEPITVRVGDQARTLGVGPEGLEAAEPATGGLVVDLDPAAFTDLVREARSAFGLVMAGRVAGDARST